MLGGGWASLAFGAALTLSTLWRYGWWLYLNPECVPLLLGLSRSTADVALGFVLASLLQVWMCDGVCTDTRGFSRLAAPEACVAWSARTPYTRYLGLA